MADDRTLRDCRILVVEDEYMLADELQTELGDAGAVVLGPAGTIEDALDLIAGKERIDGAVLDIDIRGDPVFPVADLLAEREVPFVFTTGYDAPSIPARFAHIARCGKPVDVSKLKRAIGRVIHA